MRLMQSLAVLACCVSAARAAESVTVAWDPNPEADITGYRVLYGTASKSYTQEIDVGNLATATIAGLDDTSTYFFAVVSYNANGTESAPSDEVVSPTPQQHLSNVSTRAFAQQGDRVVIGGFIIKGGGKRILIRGLGPSLTALGVPGALADPVLDMYDGTGALIASNTKWRSSSEIEIQQSGLAPSNDNESAIITSLPEGAYTVVLQGANGTTGAALMEIFELNPQESSKIVNLSTRAYVETGDNVMIGGFIIGGNQPTSVIIRAIGPSLLQYGISDALLDPMLELHDNNGSLIFQNDNWRTDQAQQILASGLAPSDDRESAIIATLPAGSYTVIVRGAAGSAGSALVEVYSVSS